MNRIGDRPAINTPRSYQISEISDEMYSQLEEAQGEGLLSQLQRLTDSSISFKLSYAQDKFLNGAWLEAYVWDEARNLLDEAGQPLFDDCRWNQILDGETNNELDVAMTYKAQLIIAECKTGEKGTFSADTIYKLDSVASSFGGKFVGKLLITSLEPSEVMTEQAFKDFSARADSKGIVIVTKDQLPTVGQILEIQAKNPNYARI